MKRWTVMLIPYDRAGTQTFTLSTLHFALVAGVLAVCTFSSAFFYQRQEAILARAQELQKINHTLRRENARQSDAAAPENDVARDHEIEALRAEYETSLSTISAELSALRAEEAKAREIHGIPPRRSHEQEFDGRGGNGKGGAPGGFGMEVYSGLDEALRPPQVIEGVARPSADLILQEIRTRMQSLEELTQDLERQQDQAERRPTLWPLAHNAGHISSSFGTRRDPINNHLRHHDGTDIAAPIGTTVYATGKGVVKASFFDKYLGNLVKIDHGNGLETWYAHLSRRLVKEGEAVDRKTPIGKVGTTGRSTGPHLHYEVHRNGKPVDGAKYLPD